MRYDIQWVIEGDSAQAVLIEQGYVSREIEKRNGVWWARMVKEIKEEIKEEEEGK